MEKFIFNKLKLIIVGVAFFLYTPLYGLMPPYDNSIPIPSSALNKISEAQSQSIKLTRDFPVPVILVDFIDHPSQRDSRVFDSLFFGHSNSVSDFYMENSLNQISFITLHPIKWIRAPQTKTYYLTHVSQIIPDIRNQIDSLIDFSLYDFDKNGVCDGLCIVASGQGAEFTRRTSDFWSHKGSTSGFLSEEGVLVNSYIITPEYYLDTSDWPIGVIAHEMGHLYGGLPDLYDIDGSSNGLGNSSLMAYGSWLGIRGSRPAHFDPLCKKRMGMLDYNSFYGNGQVVFPPIETSNYCVQLSISPTEYYLLENNSRIGYNDNSIWKGLFIYHVDESQNNNLNEWYPGQNIGNYLIAFEQADGFYHLEQKINRGEPKDVYNSGHEFTPSTEPSSDGYNIKSNIRITNIQVNGNSLSVNISTEIISSVDDNIETEAKKLGLTVKDGRYLEVSSNSYTGNIIVYNLLGQHQLDFHIYSKGTFTTNDLASGNYILVYNNSVNRQTILFTIIK